MPRRVPDSAGRAPSTTASGREIRDVYVRADVADLDYARDLADPGDPPFTRGLHASGYRGKLWTMRQFAGFGTPEETNARYRALLAAGGTGLSVAFDLPTLMGRDADDPLAVGEVGTCGVSVCALADMEALLAGIDIGRVSTSMTINAPAPMLFAMYLVVAEGQGASWPSLAGTIQNDILKEFVAQKEFIFPPRPSMRFATDLIAFASRETPKWNPISVSGYHMREAGSTAAQELAFTLRSGLEYVQAGIDAGLDVERFAPQISFFFNAHNDLFEEIAKFRAARRLWARLMEERCGARSPRARRLRFHAQTAGVSLTAQEPYNNVARTALQALAAVLGGANSLHTNALDEALSLPTADAAMLALRTQQVLAHETGLAEWVDPFGGSWFLERLTLDLEAEALRYIAEIDRLGGMVEAIERGYPQREIEIVAYRAQQAIERTERLVIGVNAFADAGAWSIPTTTVGAHVAPARLERLASIRAGRDRRRVGAALEALRHAARGTANTMPPLLECVRAQATLGEMCTVLRAEWGEYTESPPVW